MLWFVVVSCLHSHTWAGSLYCYAWKSREVSYGQESEAACDKWAKEYLTEKYHIHLGEFEWGYKCALKAPTSPYEPKKLTGE